MLLFDEDFDCSDERAERVEAEWTGAWLGQSRSGGVTYVSPGGAMFGSTEARLIVEVLHSAPRKRAKADSVGDFDLSLPSGRLRVEEADGDGRSTTIELPSGDWRARWSGFGEAAAEALGHERRRTAAMRPDHYLLQLWPRTVSQGVAISRGR